MFYLENAICRHNIFAVDRGGQDWLFFITRCRDSQLTDYNVNMPSIAKWKINDRKSSTAYEVRHFPERNAVTSRGHTCHDLDHYRMRQCPSKCQPFRSQKGRHTDRF